MCELNEFQNDNKNVSYSNLKMWPDSVLNIQNGLTEKETYTKYKKIAKKIVKKIA